MERLRPGRAACRRTRASLGPSSHPGRPARYTSPQEAGFKLGPVFESSFPRRQQARRLRRAAASGAAAIAAGALALIAIGAGATALAGLLALVMAALVLDARRWAAWPLAAASALSPRLRSGERSAG